MPNALSKIADPELRALTESVDSGEPVDVLVELRTEPTAAPPWAVTKGIRVPSRKDLSAEPSESFDPKTADMDRLEEALSALGPLAPPVRLATAQAFMVRLTAAQLRQAADLPLTGVIRPNRTHFRTGRR
jgi:hypothetical protein